MNNRRRVEIKRKRTKKLKKYFEIREQELIYGEELLNMLLASQEARLKLPRRHADFFETATKEGKELSVAESYSRILESQTGEKSISMRLAEDPPDVEIKTDQNRTLGVEITELVNSKAIEYQIKESPKYVYELLSWNINKFLTMMQAIISSKASKCKEIASKYDAMHLVIFTDEPMLSSSMIYSYLNGKSFDSADIFESIYILTSYEPSKKGKSLIRVST